MKISNPKLLPILLMLLTFYGCDNWAGLSKSKHSSNLGVIMGSRRGAAFTEKYIIKALNAPGFDLSKRYTPTTKDITQTNHLFFLKVIGVGMPTSAYKLPSTIEKNRSQLKNYFSQYVGYIMPNGDKAIHINLVWNENKAIGVDSDYVLAADDENRNWQVDINLTNQKVIDVKVKG
jgi:hypothetical protein